MPLFTRKAVVIPVEMWRAIGRAPRNVLQPYRTRFGAIPQANNKPDCTDYTANKIECASREIRKWSLSRHPLHFLSVQIHAVPAYFVTAPNTDAWDESQTPSQAFTRTTLI
jgi:hypothetical protein